MNVAALPPALLDAIKAQNAILFLGAGASTNAVHPRNERVPDAELLRDMISDKFLGGELKSRSLSEVAELAANETDLFSLQEFIRDTFFDFQPTPSHLLLPNFYWHALVTTNYDLLIERAYLGRSGICQSPVTFIKDGQKYERALKEKFNGVPLLKLHGCIDHFDDLDNPLILTSEQYVRFDRNRQRLFSTLRGMAHEFPIIFCGYSLADPHIQHILFDLTDTAIARPMYYVVRPKFSEIEKRYWSARRITPISLAFSDFMDAIESAIPANERSLPRALGGGEESIRKFYHVPSPAESEALKAFLREDADHLRKDMPITEGKGRLFYLGHEFGFWPIEKGLDVRRRLTDSFLLDAVLIDENERPALVDFYVFKGPAGNGKTIILKRAAWDAAVEYDKLVLFIKEGGTPRPDVLMQIHSLAQQRIFVFIDRAALRVDEIHSLIRFAMGKELPLTIISAERDNEWNVRCDDLDEFVVKEYSVPYLNEEEIDGLLKKLEEHGALGVLASLSYLERFSAFHDRAQRQLLVALHEATLGRRFEEIVYDEYQRIIPAAAQQLYLDVCTLNQYDVTVRAGLISRISGIRFDDFKRDFIEPLQNVVRARFDSYSRDYVYVARHPHIAELVFKNVFENAETKYDQIIRVMDGMNIDYSGDLEAFRRLTRGHVIAEEFSSYELGRRFFETAERLLRSDPYILQQHAIFEMHHKGGSLSTAEKMLGKSRELAPYDKSILHSSAVLASVVSRE